MANLKPRKRGRGAGQNVSDRPEEPPIQPQGPGTLVPLPLEAVRRYRLRYNLPIATPMSFSGFLLDGSVGKHSATHLRHRRLSYTAASAAVMDHISDGIIKEGDAIAEFLYTVQHRDQVFKLRFGKDDRAGIMERLNDAPSETASKTGAGPIGKPVTAEPSNGAKANADSHIPLPVEPLSARSST